MAENDASEVLARLTKLEREGVRAVADAMKHWDARVTGRDFRKRVAVRLIAKGVLEEKWCYRVNEHDCLTDRWGVGYRLTDGLGCEVARLLKAEDEAYWARKREEWACAAGVHP